MIRINLNPQRKKRKASSPSAVSSSSSTEVKAALILAAMAVGWVLIAGAAYYQLDAETQQVTTLRAEDTRLKAEAKRIADDIKEEELQAIKDRVSQIQNARERVENSSRNPVFVMHELANILTPGLMPDIDAEAQRRRVADDPDAKLNPQWDGTSVWMNSIVEIQDGGIEIVGGARDASDLSEFVKRLRASSRFADVANPEFTEQVAAASGRPGGDGLRYISFKLTTKVSYWD